MPHLIRGLIDGDGSISFYSREKYGRNVHTKAIRMCQGNEKFLQDFVDYMYNNYGVEKVSLFREKENLWSFAYRKNESLKTIIKIVYNNSKIFMKRKMELINLINEEIDFYNGEIKNEI